MENKPATIKSATAKSPQKRNLTGIPRHIRDLTVDVHANIQQWNDLHLRGLDVLKVVTQQDQSKGHSEKLDNLCNELEGICSSLKRVVRNIEQIQKQVKVVMSLPAEEKFFKTWTTAEFGQAVESIYEGYRQELEIKQKVVENVAHGYTESWEMLHLAMWVHQVSLPPNITVLFESVLKETGLR